MRQGQQSRRGRGRGRKVQSNLTRNYESNGPDVKIRGTASHIVDKYLALARDALASGDNVASENYLQHAEHYHRIIMAAQAQQASAGPSGDGANGSGGSSDNRRNAPGEEGENKEREEMTAGAADGASSGKTRSARAAGRGHNGSGDARKDGDASKGEQVETASGNSPDEAVT